MQAPIWERNSFIHELTEALKFKFIRLHMTGKVCEIAFKFKSRIWSQIRSRFPVKLCSQTRSRFRLIGDTDAEALNLNIFFFRKGPCEL